MYFRRINMAGVGSSWSELGDEIQKLSEAAISVKSNAHCPYSMFRVGAALLCHDGSIYTGCNVENASYGNTVCAERVAIFNAVSHGKKEFKAMAVSCDAIRDEFSASCGACRQCFVEFGTEWDLYFVMPHNKRWIKVSVADLVPMAFGPESLREERIEQPLSSNN